MPESQNLVQCYNRGCGQLFDPNQNDKDECRHHPGSPVFHDAYKGWSCCNKKSVDFTEFLNIKGCTLSKHSNVKPPEPEKKALDKDLDKKEVIEVRAPVVGPQLPRPPFDTPLVTLKPTVAEALKQAVQNTSQPTAAADDGVVAIGTSCKNGGCGVTYEGPHTNDSMCTYHPGCPVFHEGLKFWSCCQKRTTDFNTFLSQPGCTTGTHKWTKEKYDPVLSFVKLNPIRLNTKLVFREQGDASFDLDLELRGVISVEKSTASMLSTKIEIKLKKGEPGAWSKLDFPRTEPKKVEPKPQEVQPAEDDYEDLSTVEAVQSMGKVNVSG
ncbi:hypothetical protein SFRURICE_020468 [Spodoptera frugiperda]|nr:hypothetical protein SFRURICE_020468 [Spodoptera frugiperda]